MPMQGTFDATQFEPIQGLEVHPVGKFPAQITNTTIKPTKANDGGMFAIEYTTPAGKIVDNHQIWNNNPKTVEIAHKQLSAVCHATGVFRLDWQNDGAALRGARLMIEVGQQIDNQTKQPNGYVEVKKVFDSNGNEPGKPASQPAMQQASAPANPPMTQQPGGGWGQPANPPASGGWGNQGNQPAQQQPNNPPNPPANAGWQQQPQSGATAPNLPPWANRG